MAVHNLRDMQWGLQGVKPYVKSFDEALSEAVKTEEELRGRRNWCGC
jgi:4,5-DOPA dioxygenase extradiol